MSSNKRKKKKKVSHAVKSVVAEKKIVGKKGLTIPVLGIVYLFVTKDRAQTRGVVKDSRFEVKQMVRRRRSGGQMRMRRVS